MYKKNLIFLCGLLFSLSMTLVAASAQKNYVDGVVATVGRTPILHSDVLQEMLPLMQSADVANATPEEQSSKFKEFFDQALEQVIETHILYLEAVALNVSIPDDDVEKRFNEIKKGYGSTEEFQKVLAGTGYTISDFRNRLRRQIMAATVSRSKRNQFEKQVVITEEDINSYYQEHKQEFEYPGRYKVRRIFIEVPESEKERAKGKEQLEEIRIRIIQGADFGEIAKEMSKGPEAPEGGLLGWVQSKDLVEPLGSTIVSLPVGDISPVIETKYGLHIVKVEAVEEAGTLSLNDAKNQIEPIVRRQKAEERYRQWMGSLRKRNNVRVLL